MGTRLVSALKTLRDAPLADEEYHGPVLFSADAASSIFADMVGDNVLGIKPDLGETGRAKEPGEQITKHAFFRNLFRWRMIQLWPVSIISRYSAITASTTKG